LPTKADCRGKAAYSVANEFACAIEKAPLTNGAD